MDNSSPLPEIKQICILIDGHVQGVGFRYFVYDFAQQNDLTGWVRNRISGQVEVLAEGPYETLLKLLDHVRRGPSHSMVTGVTAEWSDAVGKFSQFSMLPTD